MRDAKQHSLIVKLQFHKPCTAAYALRLARKYIQANYVTCDETEDNPFKVSAIKPGDDAPVFPRKGSGLAKGTRLSRAVK
jgi:hypothetical protein